MVFAILGVCLVLAGSLMSYRAFLESRYIPAMGRVLSSELREETDRMSGSSATSRRWRLFVAYEYWVGGAHYTSDRVASRRPSSRASSGQPPSPELEALLDRYAPGREIEVFVSASDPARAVLIKGGLGGLWLVVAGVICGGAALAVSFRVV